MVEEKKEVDNDGNEDEDKENKKGKEDNGKEIEKEEILYDGFDSPS